MLQLDLPDDGPTVAPACDRGHLHRELPLRSATRRCLVTAPATTRNTSDRASATFVDHLHDLDVPIFTASPGGQEFQHPVGWSAFTAEGNEARLSRARSGDAVCGLMGGRVAVVDVDARNGGDVETVRLLLAELGVTVFAEVGTPGGGVHFYVAGHADLPTTHRLVGYPGVDVQSHGALVYLPGTARPKYGGRGYEVVMDNLDALGDGGDPDGADALAGWVGEHIETKALAFDPSPVWDGTPPDGRQQAYLDAAVRNQAERAGSAPSGQRNHAVFIAGLSLGNYVSGAGLDEARVVTALTEAAAVSGLVADDGIGTVRASIRSGLRCGKQQPRAVPPSNGGGLDDLVPAELSSVDDLTEQVELLRTRRGDELVVRRVRYLWEGRIPLGAVTVMPGEEGIGKSTLNARLAADVTRGTLPGELQGRPASVLIVAPEDHVEAVVAPRLVEAGADMSRIIFIDARLDIAGAEHEAILPRDAPGLAHTIEAEGAALVLIDSLVTTLPEQLKSIAYKDMATVLKRLGAFAEAADVAVLAPWHLNKSSGSDTALRMMDSRALRTATRSVLLVVADPE